MLNQEFKRNILWGLLCLVALLPALSMAAADRSLPYPDAEPDADEIARQVYFANHFYAFQNFSIVKRARTMSVLITREPDGDLSTTALERHLNNAYDDGDIRSRDLAIFHSGKMRGTGMLVTDFAADDRSQSYMVWVPALRKIRRFAEPAHEDAWGGSVFTFGDVTLRKPEHETHELMGRKKFRTCLGAIEELEKEFYRYAGKMPERSCRHVNKEVYGLKSTTRFDDWWYDYRISYVDTRTFADYRTLYYKNGKLIKVIDRDWGVVPDTENGDPRALFWKSWYGLDVVTGRESWAIVPQQVVEFNTDRKDSFWTQKTLRRLKR